MKQLTIATYNICHGHYAGLDWTKLASSILASGADVVGIQEMDMFTNRVGGADSLKGLSEAAGMPYSLFVPAMDFDGGQYGTAILSRLPMETLEMRPLYDGGYEPRAYGAVTVTTEDGSRLVFANTHLSYEDKKTRAMQIKQLSFRLYTMLPEPLPTVLTGDFNTDDFSALSPFRTAGMELVNNGEQEYKTFRTDPAAIDNILYSRDKLIPLESGMIDSDMSDHNLLWCRFQLN